METSTSKRPTVAEWQKTLTDAFSSNGVVGTRTVELHEYEKKHLIYITEKFIGHDLLMNSFFDFYTDTLGAISQYLSKNGWPKDKPWFSVLLTKHISLLKTFRAADKIFYHGYPNDAFGLLRDVRDRALYFGAVINKYTTLQNIEGLDNSELKTKEDHKKKNIRAKENRGDAILMMCGAKAGLKDEYQPELRRWADMFHYQVHGAGFTDVGLFGNLQDGFLPLHPVIDDDQIVLYLNRSVELAWMVVRLLCALQLEPIQFGKEWLSKWHILDDSFCFFEHGLAELGKPIGYAIIELLNTKFNFHPKATFYSE